MADYSFGGTDEENAELKKLNAEVVRQAHVTTDSLAYGHSSTTQIASSIGKSSSAPQNHWKEG